MPWFKVDDKLHSHRKVRKAGKSAMGLWVLAGSYCMDNDTDGFVPADVIKVWGCTAKDADRLVDAGFWRNATHKGEDGWRFHDWTVFQPSAAVTAAKKAKERESGLLGNHKRWHVERKINDPDCEYCYRVPDGAPDDEPIGSASGPGESPPNRPVPVPDPIPETPDSPIGESSRELALAEAPRTDVDQICEHLAARIEANGSKRPTITAKWRDAARLMLDLDKRTENDIHGAIDWCQSDEFWRANILSLPKLREKYDQLRMQAQRTSGSTSRNEEWRSMQERQMARAVEREKEMGLR